MLTAPGLSVIVSAIEEARHIFERMNAYAIYRISETIRIMFFVVGAMIFFHFYPITAVMIILLAFFNDVPIMTIASAFVTDVVKVVVYRHLSHEVPRHHRFLSQLTRPLHAFGHRR